MEVRTNPKQRSQISPNNKEYALRLGWPSEESREDLDLRFSRLSSAEGFHSPRLNFPLGSEFQMQRIEGFVRVRLGDRNGTGHPKIGRV
jgi:hypothetical protein